MKALSRSTWLCLGLTLLAILQAIRLSYISRQPLRSLSSPQYPQHPNEEARPSAVETLTVPPLSTGPAHSLMDDTQLANDPSNLFYFVQVSDLHISKFRSQTDHFLHFVRSALPVIRPSFVVVTGDLTDAKDTDDIKTRQFKEEWQLYQSAVEQGSDLAWYDMRGNHDCFDMPSWQSDVNLYRTFGRSAKLLEQGQGVYSWHVNQTYGQYRFVALDACPKRGPARPLNFYGYLPTNTMDRLEDTLLDGRIYNHTFLFTHYPTTTMVFGQSSLGHTFKDLMRQTSVYFCGHLHRLMFGLGDILKSYDTTTDSLELELGDMKDHGVYRILAVDHDLVSFVDVELPLQPANDVYDFPLSDDNKVIWPDTIPLAPVILITNPKDARYFLTNKEPTQRIRTSTHIRFLVFSTHPPTSLKVRIFVDNKHHPFPATWSGNEHTPLWTSPWSPEDFDDISTHSLRIQVTAPDAQVGESQVLFRVDSVRLMIGGGFGEWLIGTSAANIFKYTAIFGLTFMLLLLLVPKVYTDIMTTKLQQQQQLDDDDAYSKKTMAPSTRVMLSLHELDADPYAGPYRCIRRQCLAWLLRFLQFPVVMPRVFYTTLIFVLSFLCLPWFRAEFIPSGDHTADGGRYGTFYLWGFVFGNNEWLPLGDSFMFAVFHLCFDVGVFLILFAWRATDIEDLHCPTVAEGGPLLQGQQQQQQQQWNRALWFKILEVVYWIWRMSSVMAIGSFYGWPALMLNSLVLWMLFAAGVLVWGKDGYRSTKGRSRIHTALEGCPHCQTLSSGTTLAAAPHSSLSLYSSPQQHGPASATNPSSSYDHSIDDHDSTSSSSSSTSQTNKDGTRIKSRRRQ